MKKDMPINGVWLGLIACFIVWILGLAFWDIDLPRDSILNNPLYFVGSLFIFIYFSFTVSYLIWKLNSPVAISPYEKTTVVSSTPPIKIKSRANDDSPIFFDWLAIPSDGWLSVAKTAIVGGSGGGKKGWYLVPDIPGIYRQFGPHFSLNIGDNFEYFYTLDEKRALGWVYEDLRNACGDVGRSFNENAPIRIAVLPGPDLGFDIEAISKIISTWDYGKWANARIADLTDEVKDLRRTVQVERLMKESKVKNLSDRMKADPVEEEYFERKRREYERS